MTYELGDALNNKKANRLAQQRLPKIYKSTQEANKAAVSDTGGRPFANLSITVEA